MTETTTFQDAMRAAGLNPPECLEPGRRYRFPGAGKRNGNQAGWCRLFPDGLGGCFGDWSSGLSESWQAKRDRPLTDEERRAFAQQVKAEQARAEEERRQEQERAAGRAAEIWARLAPAPAEHPYLATKGVKPCGLLVDKGGRLVAALRDGGGKVWSLQFIGPDGAKRFLTGGRITGCYFSIGKPDEVLCIAEGFATAASIHEATGYAVAVAFNAGNLEDVARTVREKFPEARIILCADDDYRAEGNPGITKAKAAALATGGLLAVPGFGPERGEKDTDFNDLAKLRGLSEVRRCIAAALAPEEETAGASSPEGPDDDQTIIRRLAALSPFEYDRIREEQAKALKVRAATLDKLVAAERKGAEKEEAAIDFDQVAPWPEPVNPAALLSEVSATVRRFIICQKETADAVALWAAMTWLIDVVQIAPLAVVTAPEKRCGKSQLLFLLGRLTCRPLTASNISPAALFRAIDKWKPTLLVDEADAFMKENEELRGLLNCGHTRDSAYIVRVVGDDFTPTRFNVWGAKALAGIGRMADTLMDRSITLELRRKMPHESVDRLRHAESGLFKDLSRKLARFADDAREAVRLARPVLPPSLNDRAQDNWEPLLAIAEAAGGPWPDLARSAALKLSGAENPLQSVGTELLADIQETFETKRVDRISTAALIEALCADDEKPWATYNRGKSISPRQVSSRLADYGIRSKTIRIGPDTPKGYEREQFEEAFSRYLASPPLPSATSATSNSGAGFSVADETQRCGKERQKATPNRLESLPCCGVADKKGVLPEKRKRIEVVV